MPTNRFNPTIDTCKLVLKAKLLFFFLSLVVINHALAGTAEACFVLPGWEGLPSHDQNLWIQVIMRQSVGFCCGGSTCSSQILQVFHRILSFETFFFLLIANAIIKIVLEYWLNCENKLESKLFQGEDCANPNILNKNCLDPNYNC